MALFLPIASALGSSLAAGAPAAAGSGILAGLGKLAGGFLGGGGGSRSRSASTASLNATVNPVITVISGPGRVDAQSSGSASGSPSASAAGDDVLPAFLPSTPFFGQRPVAQASSIDALPADFRTVEAGFGGLFDSPVVLIALAAGAALLFFDGGK